MRNRIVLVLPLAIAFVLSCCAQAQEWTRFRGPNGTGIAESAIDAPDQWSESDYNWRVPVPGRGHASPVLWGDKVFLLSANDDKETRYALCYSAADGRELWRREFPLTPHHLNNRNSYASSTPAVDGERVYFSWADPESVVLAAFDHQGNQAWIRDLGTWTSQHGYAISPMLYDGMVILSLSQQSDQLAEGQIAGESKMVAIDAKTGKTRWSAPRTTNRVCYSIPTIYTPAGAPPELICTSTGDGVFSLDPKTGEENWRVPDVFRMRVVSSPLLAGGLIFGSTGSGGGGNYVAAVTPGSNGKVVYKVERNAPYVPCVVAKDGLAFLCGDKGVVTCISVASGDVQWVERVAVGFSGSPVIAGDKLYCIGDRDGVVYVIAAKANYELLGQNPLGEECRSTPAIASGRMYLRTLSHLISLGGTDL